MRGHGRNLDISSMQKAKAVSCPGSICLQSHSTLFSYCVLHQKGAGSIELCFPPLMTSGFLLTHLMKGTSKRSEDRGKKEPASTGKGDSVSFRNFRLIEIHLDSPILIPKVPCS